MDIFCEYMVKREKGAKEVLQTVGIILAAVLLSGVLFLFNSYLFGLGLLLIAGVWYGAYVLISRSNVEYEYIVTSTVLDVDRILARRSRKRILSIDLKEIEACCPAENMSGGADKKITDATPRGIEDGVYGIDFDKNGIKNRLLIKPGKKMLTYMKKASPSLVTLRPEDIER